MKELYFKKNFEWREWLSKNYNSSKGVYLIFYKVSSGIPSMRWEEAVRVALCYGWIDSTVKKLMRNEGDSYLPQETPKVFGVN